MGHSCNYMGHNCDYIGDNCKHIGHNYDNTKRRPSWRATAAVTTTSSRFGLVRRAAPATREDDRDGIRDTCIDVCVDLHQTSCDKPLESS